MSYEYVYDFVFHATLPRQFSFQTETEQLILATHK